MLPNSFAVSAILRFYSGVSALVNRAAITMVSRFVPFYLASSLLALAYLCTSGADPLLAQTQLAAGQGMAQLEAKQQRREGQMFYADGDVEIRYKNMVLRCV